MNSPAPRIETRGRKKVFGRCANREEFLHMIWDKWTNTASSQADIANSLRCSAATVGTILRNKDGYADYLRVAQEKKHELQTSLSSRQ